MKRIFIYSLHIFLLHLISCSDSSYESNIPDVRFRVKIDLQNDPFLRAPGNYKVFDYGGYKGLLVYNLDGNIFYAYDLACTHENGAHVITSKKQGSEPTIICETCGSHFNLITAGAPIKAPALYPLRSYSCTRSNISIWVTN
ncbi:Rieske 2Fe-2S domain-containing protein [Halosquirtibacter xylanolyticus]|uniref:Rieske (2Fe-2S) protein n=1 Tax=Halosquirtibacter xylanolyticus TaxID=3374599 RepID=UPI003747A0E7|nr:Rieske 2Fe-2S domain-containing protein [Prolixibacteraceae bacterium]